jgi:hypothetical protein
MNWETIIVALIAALGPLIGTILTIRQQNRLIDWRMEQVEGSIKGLSSKVDKHNNFDRRLIVIETTLGIKHEEKKNEG